MHNQFYIKISGSSEGGYSTGESVSYTPMTVIRGNNSTIEAMVRVLYSGGDSYYRWASLISSDDSHIHVAYVEEDGGATHTIGIREKNSILRLAQ